MPPTRLNACEGNGLVNFDPINKLAHMPRRSPADNEVFKASGQHRHNARRTGFAFNDQVRTGQRANIDNDVV